MQQIKKYEKYKRKVDIKHEKREKVRIHRIFTKMHISYKPLWHTLVERNMRKEDLRIAAGLTTNMIANMGKGKNISMETLVRICETLNCGILDVIELEQD